MFEIIRNYNHNGQSGIEFLEKKDSFEEIIDSMQETIENIKENMVFPDDPETHYNEEYQNIRMPNTKCTDIKWKDSITPFWRAYSLKSAWYDELIIRKIS